MSSWRAVVSVLRSPSRTLIDDVVATLFPADCRCCDGPLDRAGLVPVCETCVGRVVPNLRPGCERCSDAPEVELDLEDARFAAMLAEGMLCRECRLAAPAFTRAVAFANYTNEMRVLIGLLKFGGLRGVARLLGGHLGQAVLQLEGLAASELTVIAVPLYKDREAQRGYNQSVLLADEALRWLRRERPDWKLTADHAALIRRRSTESSFLLSPRGRRQNLKGAFQCVGDVRGLEVLLIDDILTSGATARECARVLMQAGAAKVWVATLARAQKRALFLHEDPGDQVARWDLAGVGTAA